MADTARYGPDQNLAILRAVDLYIFDLKGLFWTMKNRGFHLQTP
jgi:hypothetical protein